MSVCPASTPARYANSHDRFGRGLGWGCGWRFILRLFRRRFAIRNIRHVRRHLIPINRRWHDRHRQGFFLANLAVLDIGKITFGEANLIHGCRVSPFTSQCKRNTQPPVRALGATQQQRESPIAMFNICITCQKEFKVYPYEAAKRKFCSDTCYNVSRGLTTWINCATCQKPFEVFVTALPRKKYCSLKCRNAPGEHPEMTCEQCGKIFTTYPSAIKNGRKFCSEACGHAHQLREPEERFWEKVNKTESCWPWTAATNPLGYGIFGLAPGQNVLAHRFSWSLVHGPIQDDLQICHDCPNGDCPSCCRPDHLFIGTQLDNMRDSVKKKRNAFGERNGHAKVTEAQVIEMRKLRSNGMTLRALAEQFGIHSTSVLQIVTGKNWKHLPLSESEQLTML